MGAIAFKTENATRCYEVEIAETSDYQELVKSLNEEIRQIFGKTLDYCTYEPEERLDSDSSYPGRYLDHIRHQIKEHNLVICPVVRAGYHDGVNLDYDVKIEWRGQDLESVEELVVLLREDGEPYKLVEKSMNRHLKIITNELEKIYEKRKSCYAPRNAYA